MKQIKINNVKVKAFDKNDLIEKLGRTNEEWCLVKKYQKKFYQLLQDSEGFCVDARMLWEELDKPHGQFNKWIERKLIKKGFIENKDFSKVDKSVHVKNSNLVRPQVDYFLTVETSKNVAMMENTDSGKLVRDYFILMEKCVREYEKWVNTREPQKQGNNIMKSVIKSTYEKENNKSPKFYIYCNENDLLNESLVGMKAKQLQDYLDMSDKNTREHLTEKVNFALAQLQFLNTSLINSGVKFNERKIIIQNTVDMNYKDIRLEIDKIRNNKMDNKEVI